MKLLKKLVIALKVMTSLSLLSASYVSTANDTVTSGFVAQHVDTAIVIDGQLDKQWDKATWHNLDQPILGGMPDTSDFNGRFKLLWDKHALYLVAEFEDDVLIDKIADPLSFYWDDDTLEIFLDEDASGGDHQFNYNAFAYHVALDNQVVDIGEKDGSGNTPFLTLNDHIKSRWMRHQNGKVIWELAISVYDDKFKPNMGKKPVTLHAGKVLGFMLAYCDNDGSKTREHFIGSTKIEPINGDTNLGYRLADVFSKLTLISN